LQGALDYRFREVLQEGVVAERVVGRDVILEQFIQEFG
jgi:hypothetical protein